MKNIYIRCSLFPDFVVFQFHHILIFAENSSIYIKRNIENTFLERVTKCSLVSSFYRSAYQFHARSSFA